MATRNDDAEERRNRTDRDASGVDGKEIHAGWMPTPIEVRGYQPAASGKPEGKNPPHAVSSVTPPAQRAACTETRSGEATRSGAE
jgi:hypothetical protein